MTAVTTPAPFSKDDMARRRRRSIAMAIAIGVLMVLFFITTIVRLGGGAA